MPLNGEQALSEIPLFAGLPREALAAIEECASSVRFDADVQLLRRGAEADVFYVIRQGSVQLETFVPARGPVAIETLEAGEILGLSWLTAPRRWHLDARTVSPLAATALDANRLRARFQDSPELGYLVMSRVADAMLERLQWTRMRLLDVYHADERR